MIEILDARAARWPTPLRWLYVGMKWSLVLLGAWIMVNLAHERWESIKALVREGLLHL